MGSAECRVLVLAGILDPKQGLGALLPVLTMADSGLDCACLAVCDQTGHSRVHAIGSTAAIVFDRRFDAADVILYGFPDPSPALDVAWLSRPDQSVICYVDPALASDCMRPESADAQDAILSLVAADFVLMSEGQTLDTRLTTSGLMTEAIVITTPSTESVPNAILRATTRPRKGGGPGWRLGRLFGLAARELGLFHAGSP